MRDIALSPLSDYAQLGIETLKPAGLLCTNPEARAAKERQEDRDAAAITRQSFGPQKRKKEYAQSGQRHPNLVK
jgi:hypothetical protein